MKSRVQILISGQVQGVFFRSNTQEEAKKIGITGFVRNLPDGRVEAVFEGEEKEIKKMINWIKKGPETARVENIEINRQIFKGEFKDFEIKYS
jgi:acylphosphatase